MSNQDPIRLKVPRQELDRCQYFACDEEAVRQWVEQLPIANLGQTTRQLYQALLEFNQVRLLPAKRLAILEILRTPIYYVTRGLAKHYLNQPIVLPDQPRKVAELAQTLHQQMATGYTIVATHTAALGTRAGQSKPEALIAQALHRAIADHTVNMQRHYQLYQSVKAGVWYNLHQFYALAKQHKVLNRSFEDKELGACTLEASYLRALLMGCCKPNQLRQEDFSNLIKPLTRWAALCKLTSVDEDVLFAINPTDDRPPVYRELFESVVPDNWLGLDTRPLAEHLRQLLSEPDQDSLKVSEQGHFLSRDLIGHLLLAWSAMSKRTFMRLETHETLELCIGLSATHHFVSGELSFEALVEERGAKTYTMIQENPFLKSRGHIVRQKDVWDSPYETNMGQTSVAIETVEYNIRGNEQSGTSSEKSKYRCHQVGIVNASAHGYCVAWPEGVEAAIKTGEIAGVRESNSHNWSIATIRWVRHEDNSNTQIGLELISPSAAPYGARIIRKTGGPSEYIRVLVLPELPVTRQPVSLLTPRMPFKSGMKVVLNQRAKEVQIVLNRKLNTTGAYNQFQFHRVSGTQTVKSNNDADPLDDFDSLWGNL